jgi:hypothetical protein
MKVAINPMYKGLVAAWEAPRCHATSKRTGQSCKAPAVRGWKVCRFHGAGGGAPKGEWNGRYVHGERTQDAMAARRAITELIRISREAAVSIGFDQTGD